MARRPYINRAILRIEEKVGRPGYMKSRVPNEGGLRMVVYEVAGGLEAMEASVSRLDTGLANMRRSSGSRIYSRPRVVAYATSRAAPRGSIGFGGEP